MKRAVAAAAALALLAIGQAGPHAARAQVTDNVVKVGVLTDMSSLYSDINGQGAVIATQMAIDEMGGTVLGKKIEMIQADVQNKPDVAVSTAGRWYDVEKVDMILGAAASSSSIATMGVAAQKRGFFSRSTQPRPTSPANCATPTRCTGITTPRRWLTAPARRSSSPAATAGSL